jgi:hypothetical protein
MELGSEGLLEEDQWIMEVKFVETTLGHKDEYWLLAI